MEKDLKNKQSTSQGIHYQINSAGGQFPMSRLEREFNNQRQTNQNLKDNILCVQRETNEKAEQLNMVLDDTQVLHLDIKNVESELLIHDDQIEQSHANNYDAIEKIVKTTDQINRLEDEQIQIQEEIRKVEMTVEEQAMERMDMHDQLAKGTQDLDMFRQDCEADKIIMHRNQAWDEKLIVTNLLARCLDCMVHNTKRSAFKELEHFYRFDETCFNSLRRLSQIRMFKLGQMRQKDALLKWYNNALKPFELVV